MPTYVYKFVETGETIEVQQGFHDETLTEYVHPDTGKTMAVKKVFTPVGVTFKGSGFFKTDSRSSTSGSKPGGKDGKDAGTGDSAASTGGDTGSSSGSSSDGGGSSGGSTASSAGSSAGSTAD